MKNLSRIWPCLIITLLFVSCKSDKKNESIQKDIKVEKPLTFTTPLGKEFTISEPSEKNLNLYEETKKKYESNPEDVEAIIWYGRRTAYLGRYDDAISIYSEGMEKFSDEPRLYRHRGHRYISIRKFDEAITDFEKAAELIEGTENEIEPDGMPNAQNIPVSTLHGNIWYHLGLAYYLKHDYKKPMMPISNADHPESFPIISFRVHIGSI